MIRYVGWGEHGVPLVEFIFEFIFDPFPYIFIQVLALSHRAQVLTYRVKSPSIVPAALVRQQPMLASGSPSTVLYIPTNQHHLCHTSSGRR